MESLLQDVRYGVRSLRKAPGFLALAALTLGLGIGANAVVLGLVRGLLWRPPPVADPERLAVVFSQARADGAFGDFSHADYLDFRRATGDVFTGLIAYYPVTLGVSGPGASERSWGEAVSGNYFDVLGVRAARGRTLTEEDERPGGEEAVVLSHGLWVKRFQADPAIVGTTLKLSGRSFTVAGVAPEGFHGVYFTGFQPDLWITAPAFDRLSDRGAPLDERGASTFRILGRLRPGATVEEAQAVVGTVAARLEKEFPRTNAGLGAAVMSERASRPEPESAAASSVMAALFLVAVGLVLLIACANVANLLLARGASRQAEFAVRVSLGADRRRLARQLLTESLLLAGAGGVVGLLGAVWATDALSAGIRMPTDIPFAFDLRLDRSSVLLSLGACLAAAVASSLLPALQAGADVLAPLRSEGSGGRASARSRIRNTLVIGQVAVSCVLLIAASLSYRSLTAVRAVDPGFDTRGGLLASVAPGLQGYDTARGLALYRRLQEAVSGLPGVRGASLASFVPLEFSSRGGLLYVEGREPAAGGPAGETAGWSLVAPGYFEAMGTALVEGRGFDWRDDAQGRGVVVVNQTLAARYWPGRSALGQKVRMESAEAPALEVVGVVRDGKYRDLVERAQPYLFRPLAQEYRGEATLIVRAGGDAASLLPAVRQAVRSVDPDLPLYDLKTLDELVAGRSLLLPRLAAELAVVFAAAAVLLAMVGLYGVVSFSVARRVREVGIRMALGAPSSRILLMVVGDGARLAAWGVGLGVLLALASARALSSVLFGVSATDALTFAGVPPLVLAVAVLAAYLPARRATRVDPLSSLRSE